MYVHYQHLKLVVNTSPLSMGHLGNRMTIQTLGVSQVCPSWVYAYLWALAFKDENNKKNSGSACRTSTKKGLLDWSHVLVLKCMKYTS